MAGGMSTDTVRYLAIEVDLASGATVPQGGYLTAGEVYFLSHPERDGSSVRYISPDEQSQIAGTNFVQTERFRRREQRVFEINRDGVLVPPGLYDVAGFDISAIAISGSTARAAVDTDLQVIRSIHSVVGQEIPVTLIPWVDFGGVDIASQDIAFYGRRIVTGFMERQLDITAARGTLWARGRHAEQGGRLILAENI